MNPNSGGGAPKHEFEVPAIAENIPQTGEVQSDVALESGNPDESRVGKAQPQLTPDPQPTAVAVVATDNSQAQVTDPATAKPVSSDDAKASEHHVIEKQWVNKAKAIIAQTQDDPFVQKHQMSKVKAEYIQKRYSKTIPTEDTVPG